MRSACPMSTSLSAAAVLFAACAGGPPAAPRGAETAREPEPAVAAPADVGSVDWSSDYDAAAARAAASGRPLLVAFVGSDWCPQCRQLDELVLSQPAFAAWVRAHVVPVRLDFPRHHELPPELRAQNERIQKRFRIPGYPAVIVVDGAGAMVGVVPFTDRGVDAWLAAADAVLARVRQR